MPGGEWHISGPKLTGMEAAFVQGASADDLCALAIWADAVHRDRGVPAAIIPYLPGARQDRRQTGEALSCHVYAEMINAMKLISVVYLDPHSVAMPACLDRGVEAPLIPIVAEALAGTRFDGVIAPDVGAAKRAQIVAGHLKVPCFQAFKHRDSTTGKLSGFTCEPLPSSGKFLIVDDICDGGGTFCGLAETLKLPRERLALYVTHGIFSKGAERLETYFSAIYTTDSYISGAYAPPIKQRANVAHIMVQYI